MNTSTKRVATFTVTLPKSDSALGQWMDRHGAHIEIGCAFGTFNVTVSWCRVHGADDEGRHVEKWEISRHGKDLQAVLHGALTKAMQKTQAASAAALQKVDR